MASEIVWQKIRRVYRAPRFSPNITIRQNGDLAITADFVRMADISDCTHASLFVSADGFRLAIEFHSNNGDDDAFALSRDGGNKAEGARNRLITAAALLRQSASICSLVKGPKAARRCTPRKEGHRWVIDLAPSFELVLRDDAKVDRSVTGIYRYRSGDSVVYIGRGCIADRLAGPERAGWHFDRIEYSILNDDVREREWESFWLNEYRRANGHWPIYNKIGGVKAAASG